MARKTQETNISPAIIEHIEESPLTLALDTSYTNYAWHTIEERALPDLRDGLKPATRRILYGMKQMGLKSNGSTTKSARVTGQVCGTLHPHGDMVVYPALYRLAQEWVMRYPLIIGQGNFGSIQGHAVAAQRYCVTGDTLISTPDRGLIPVQNFSPDGLEDFSSNIHSADGATHTTNKWFDCGAHPTLNVKTRHGYCVTGTYNHPLLVMEPDFNGVPKFIWKTIPEIKIGDWLVMDRGRGNEVINPKFPPITIENKQSQDAVLPERMTTDLALILGAIVAEGNVTEKEISFCNNPGVLADKFKNAFETTFPDSRLHIFERQPVGGSKSPCLQMEIHLKQVRDFFATIGLTFENSYNKEIPHSIFASDTKCQGMFLSALYEGDGSVSLAKDGSVTVLFSTKSEKLAKQTQVLLLSLGIYSHRHLSKTKNVVRVSGRKNLQNFVNSVGFLSSAKIDKLNIGIQNLSESERTVTSSVPYFASYARKNTLDGSKFKIKQQRLDTIDNLQSDDNLRLEEILCMVKPEARETLRALVKSGLFYSQVSSISDAGFQNVYSVRVNSNCHSFIGNGFVNHNTECKLSPYGELLLDGVNENIVSYVPNYDEKETEPTILPGAFHNLLANGSSGIAVALATRIPSHNLRELTALIAAYIHKSGKMSTDEIMAIMPGPDFPTRGILRGQKGVRDYYETGRGSLLIDGSYVIEEDVKGNRTIVVSEVPYETSPKDIEHEIIELVQSEKIKGIKDVKDLSYGEKGVTVIKLVIYLDKTANAQLIANQILKHTSLRKTFSVNITAVVDKRLYQTIPILTLIEEFVEHRRIVFRNRFETERETHLKRIHIIEGYLQSLANIDKVIELIRGAKNREDAKSKLISENMVTTDVQAEAVLELKLAALTKLEGDKLQQEIDKLTTRCSWLSDKLSDDKKILKLVAEEQIDIGKKMGDDRRTKIELAAEEIVAEDLIPNEQVIVSLTKDGYIKRIGLDAYRVQRRGGKGVASSHKSQEDAGDIYVANTHDLMMFFTSNGMVYQRKTHEIPEATNRTSKGIHLANLLSLGAEEKIISAIPIATLDTDGYVVMVTNGGLIKRTELREYQTSLRQKGFTAIKLQENDSVCDVKITDGSQDIFLVTAQGQAVRYGEERVRTTGRFTQGVKALELGFDKTGRANRIVTMLTFGADQNPQILIATEYGFGKRTDSSAYREKKSRAVKGVSTISDVRFDRNGYIVGATIVEDGDTLIVLTTRGKFILLPTQQIRSTGRVAVGVKLLDLEIGDTVSSIARVQNAAQSIDE